MSGKEPPRAPVGRVQTGMASFCKPPPTAEQREQQHLEEGQKFKQQVQKQRADNQQRAAKAAKHKRKPGRPRKDAFGMHSILSKARMKQQENKRPDRERKKTRSVARRRARCNWWHPAVIIPVIEEGSDAEGSEEGGSEEGGNEERDGEKDGDDT